ncbi:hypothetical protein CEE45_00405 [Candidatus Heimdallarchaeota archaeon B3_Heim]|nr:MAG: hypothetical protein CEE45_00405 [Candidatus Heimdallarchaeota archaeon B3_Heim]
MKITVPDKIKMTNIPLMGITEADILKTIQTPESKERFLHMGLQLEFHLKNIRKGYLLVVTRNEGQDISVSEVYLIKRVFIQQLNTKNPIQVLESFIDRFGLEIRIDRETDKFFIKKAVPLSPSVDPTRAVTIINPGNHEFWLCQYIQINRSGNYLVLQVAIVYCIDITKYKQWIREMG